MTEYHVLPSLNTAQHICASACPCKPELRPEEDTNGQRVWQHRDPLLPPPIMASGLMASRAWTLFSVINSNESVTLDNTKKGTNEGS